MCWHVLLFCHFLYECECFHTYCYFGVSVFGVTVCVGTNYYFGVSVFGVTVCWHGLLFWCDCECIGMDCYCVLAVACTAILVCVSMDCYSG